MLLFAFANRGPALPSISGLVAQSEEQPVVCGKAKGANPFGSANFKILPRRRVPRFSAARFSTPAFLFNRAEFSVRSVGATRSVWARETAGANPAALTNFNRCRGRIIQAPVF